MTLRDRLLALLREANYSPANEFEISRRLDLNKKQRALLAHEVRLVLKSGEFARAGNGRIGPKHSAGNRPQAKAATRPIFTPTRRGPQIPTSGPVPLPAPAPSAPKGSKASGRTQPANRVPAAVSASPSAPKLHDNELTGRIQFRAGGSAFVVRDDIPDARNAPALQVFPEDTGVALPGDRVIARIYPGRKGRRPGEKIGSIVRVLERERDTIIGNLRRGRR